MMASINKNINKEPILVVVLVITVVGPVAFAVGQWPLGHSDDVPATCYPVGSLITVWI